MDVTSKELNLFVWTEYIPQDMQECFGLVYGIKVNRDEYSANEEMYAKLNAGGANYDIVQPTDYTVSLMARQGLLQKLDKSKLPNWKNLDPAILKIADKDVCRSAIEALGAIGDVRAVEPLIALLTDNDQTVGVAAAKALGKFGVQAMEPLIAALHDQRLQVRLAAAMTATVAQLPTL